MRKEDTKEVIRLKRKIEKTLFGEPFIFSELALKDICKDLGVLKGTPIEDKEKGQ